MIYQFLKYLFKLTFETYFNVFRVTGHENIPDGPVIFVANHPSTLMDPVVIATLLKRPIFFLAAAEFMGKGWVTKFMQRYLNMIPVYRPDTLPGEAKKNADVFYKCFEHLGNNGAILIFPEGSSVTQRKIRPLKTGAVRIALGTEEATGKKVNIVPIGLNYSNPHQFRSQAYVCIGKPLNSGMEVLKDYSESELAGKFTKYVEAGLRENVIHLEDENLFDLFEKIKKIVIHERQNRDGKTPSQKLQFELGQQIQDALTYFMREYPEEVKKLSLQLDHYLDRVTFYGVTDASVSRGNPVISWGDYFKILFGVPLFILGFVVNAGPYYLTSWLLTKMKIGPQFKGSIILNLGLVLFLIWYIFIGITSAFFMSKWWIGILVVSIMYISGKFALRYLNLMQNLKESGNWKRILKRKRNIYVSLKEERNLIIQEILQYAEQYKSSVITE